MAGWVDGDERWQVVDRDRSGDAVGLRVDHGDRAGLSVDNVNLIAKWVYRQVGRVGSNLQSPVQAEIDEVKHGDGVGAAVADVGELPVAIGDVGKAVPATARYAEEERADSGGNRS